MSTYDYEPDPKYDGPEPPHIANPPQPEQDCHATGVCVRSGLYVAAQLVQPEQEKPWVGLTDEENHIAEVLNKTLGLQYVADKLREKNT